MGKRKDKKKPKESSAPLAFNPFQALADKHQKDVRGEASAPPKASAMVQTSGKKSGIEKSSGVFSFASKVVVSREKKGRAGKTVTRISGVHEDDLEPLKKQIKKALGCGATIEGADLVLLGSLVDRAGNYLESVGAKKVVKAN